MDRFKRTLTLSAVTAGLIFLSWWLQSQVTVQSPEGFLRALSCLPGAGVILLGTGIFLRRGATAVFLDVVGGVTLAAGLTLFVLYGGMDDPTAVGADTGINLVLCLWTALPVCFAVHTLVLGLGSREDTRVRRRIAGWTPVALFAWILVLLFSGQMLHLVHAKPVEEETHHSDLAWIGSEEG